jgi:SAM-dependent methyltransferase
MRKPRTVAALATGHGLRARVLGPVLHYLALRSDLVRGTLGKYQVTTRYDREAKFLLQMYAVSYGGAATRIEGILLGKAYGPAPTRHGLANAFEDVPAAALAGVMTQLGRDHVLDIGCGTGALLQALAQANGALSAWGIDSDPGMCKRARARLAGAGLGKRVRIFRGDATRPETCIPAGVRRDVMTITACDFLNEHFADGDAGARSWMRHVADLWPRRLLFVSDYYGRLGTRRRSAGRETLVHDYAQLVSGQGIPPPDCRGWQRIYGSAGCRLLHALEDRATTRFIHIVQMP